MVRMRRTEKMMKMQPTTTLRYLASRVDGCQDDIVIPIGCLHSSSFQSGSVRMVEVPRLPVQLLGRPSLGPPRQGPHAYTAAISSFRAVHQ